MLAYFNSQNLTTIVSVACAVLLMLATGWFYFEKKFPGEAAKVPADVKKVLDTGFTWVEDLARTPWFASQAAAGKLEIRHVTDKLLQSHLGQAASQALGSFGKALDSMTQSEQGTAVEMVQSALKALGQDVTPAQALIALQTADAAIQKLSSLAQAATQRSQALSAAVTAATADVAPQ